MEEILASIRRIIADDDVSRNAANAAPPPAETPRPAAVVPPPPPPEPEPVFQPPVFEPEPAPEPAAAEVDILDLTEDMRAPAGAPSFRTIDAQPDVVFTEADAAAAADPEPDHLEAARQQLAASMSDTLLSSRTAASVDSAFNALAQTVLVQNARTLEDLVKDMLRPMLKNWLDDNLPGLVERLVRAEIERVSRGRSSS
jgi:cell pole-organizing protein PopZ